jgi:hypothetical protein
MRQWQRTIDKTRPLTTGNFNMYNQGYAYVLILKAFFYHGMLLGHECILIAGMANEGLANFDTALGTYL